MALTTKQLVFNLFFLSSWLLLLLLGESYLSYSLLGLGTIVYFSFGSHLKWSAVSKYKIFFISWIIFLVTLIISSFFTVNIPLSLYELSRYLFLFLTFSFFILIDKSFFNLQQAQFSLLFLAGLMIVLSVLLKFFTHSAYLLPGMNLLYATFGHNHLASLILLVLPSSWWIAHFLLKKGHSLIWILLPLVFCLALLFSFGRVATFIGFIQLFLLNLQLRSNSDSHYLLKRILKFLVIFFVLFLSLKLFFSISFLVKEDYGCPLPQFEKQLCKSLDSELRPYYWQRAAEIFKDNVWFGAGPGSFGLVSHKYQLTPYSNSAYAHNVFLQNLAEMGLFAGGSFMVLMIILWRGAQQKINLSFWSKKGAVFLGVSGIYLDIMFDFDWNFIGIAGITILLLALLIKDRIFSNKLKNRSQSLEKIIKSLYFFSGILLIITAGVFWRTEYLIRRQKITSAFNFFPYFHWHKKIFSSESQVIGSETSRLRYVEIYANHPGVYMDLLTQTVSTSQQSFYQSKLLELDPWTIDLPAMMDFYLQNEEWVAAEELVKKMGSLYRLSKDKGYELAYEKQLQLSEYSLVLAQHALDNNQLDSTSDLLMLVSTQRMTWEQRVKLAELLVQLGNKIASSDLNQTIVNYKLAKEHVPWILTTHQLWFENLEWRQINLNKLINFVEQTASWHGEASGWKDENKREIDEFVIQMIIQEKKWSDLYRLIDLLDWSRYSYDWRLNLIRDLTHSIDQLVLENDFIAANDLLISAQQILPNYYWLETQPANLAVLAGDYAQANQLYQQCVADFEPYTHRDCLNGLEQIKIGDIRPQRYWQASQIIRQELN